MMKLQNFLAKLVSSLLILCVAPRAALADCYPIASAPLGADCVVMPYGDQAGVWFRMDRADELRKMKLAAPELQKQVDLYADVSAALSAARDDYRMAYQAQLEATSQLEVVNKGLVAETQRARDERAKLEKKLNAWYRSPFLWFGGGIATALAIGIVAVYSSQ